MPPSVRLLAANGGLLPYVFMPLPEVKARVEATDSTSSGEKTKVADRSAGYRVLALDSSDDHSK